MLDEAMSVAAFGVFFLSIFNSNLSKIWKWVGNSLFELACATDLSQN